MKSKPGSQIIRLNGRKIVSKNSVFTVFLDDISDVHGNHVSDYLNVQPNNLKDGFSGVGVLPVIDDDVILIEIYRHPINQISMEIPKGFIEHGETASAAAVRELFEETGVEIDEEKIEMVCASSVEGGVIDGSTMLFKTYLSSELNRLVDVRPEMGIVGLKRIKKSEIMECLLSGRISDSVTQVSLLMHLNSQQRAIA